MSEDSMGVSKWLWKLRLNNLSLIWFFFLLLAVVSTDTLQTADDNITLVS